MSEQNKAYLRNLPMTMSVMLGKYRVFLVHGSPRRINEYLYEDRPQRGIERLFDMTGADVIICGHTHIPYDRHLPGGRRLVNAGSVGKPKDNDPRACYVVLENKANELIVEFVRVDYDIEQSATAIESTAMPDEFAQMLRAGSG